MVDFEKTPLAQIPWKEYLSHYYGDIPIFDVDDTGRLTEDSAVRLGEFSSESVKTMCEKCIDDQISKYGKQTIKCKGLASVEQMVPNDISHMFSSEDLSQFEEIANPYQWANNHIDLDTPAHRRMFNPRWYQEQMVRCTAKRKSYRCGRRTGKTYSFALNILHRALTNADYKVLIVTPYEVQAEELISQIREFVYRLSDEWGSYGDLVIKDVKSPNYLMQFSNRSRIRGFTTGSSGAGSVRGQAAHLIVLDEVDYMTESDFNSVLAILADNPDTELWVASTPDSKKALYRLEQIPEFKKFHFPTFVLPHYSDDLDRDFKNQLTDIGYVQEIMAEFGASELGVFQGFYIDKCIDPNGLEDKRARVLKSRNDYILIMGCDWNDDKVGTRIVVTAFDKIRKKFFIADLITVSKEGWSQIEAVQRIIDINKKYVFDHMYVDEGFGTSQIQFIKKYAVEKFGQVPEDDPDLRLANIVGINFSSKIEVVDVNGGDTMKKDAKTYMVENAARFLEKQAYEFDKVHDKDLMAQMYNYIIRGRSPSGKPTFGPDEAKIGDHDLDAFMLSMLGFAMEYSEFLNIQYSTDLIKLVARESMSSDSKEIGLPSSFKEDDLFATGISKREARSLSKGRNNMYNRASFGKSSTSAVQFGASGKNNSRKSVGPDGYYRSSNDGIDNNVMRVGSGRRSSF